MQKMRILCIGSADEFIFATSGKNPAVCKVRNIRFHETQNRLFADVDWINKGKYSNGKRKKILTRTMNHVLRQALRFAKIHTS